jgi:hypothetical protein
MSHVADLISAGDRLFSKRTPLMSFLQDVYEQFNPIGADFTGTLNLGDDFAGDLMTSYPLILARELTDTFSTMLRPSDKEWASMAVSGLKDHQAKAWLQWASRTQRSAMYDRAAQFVNATKEGDRDFGLAGQCVLTVEMMPDRSSLLYRNWHIRDTVWTDGLSGAVETVHRKWKPTAYELKRLFGTAKLHEKVRQQFEQGKDPYCEINCRHIVMPADMYHGEHKFRTPLVSIYVDVDNEHIMEVTGQRVNSYVIPRWQRLKGSPYAYSPAVICALPEARLLQAMTYTLLAAGEKAVDPPMIAAQEALRGDIDLRAGGITYYSQEYDERQGEVLRPLTGDKSGIPLGLELQNRSEAMLRQAFYLDKLDLPQRGPEMTAYEVGQRVQQYIRNALPLFEPVEVDYNGGLCERTFEVLAMNGAFGPPDTWPDSLRGEDIEFKFVSPLREAMDKQKGQVFVEGAQLVSTAVAIDPSAGSVWDASEALRDALDGIGVPVRWTRSIEQVEEIKEAAEAAAQQEQLLGAMEQAATIAKDFGAAAPVGGAL